MPEVDKVNNSKPVKSRGKSRRGHKSRHAANTALTAYPLLCFDSETTNHGELLELSVFDIEGNEVYHRYFRPHAKNWPTDIHHISPEQVADCKRFSAYRHEIETLLNSARFLLGCAISNDLHSLRRHGVRLADKRHTLFDIQNWHWLLNDDTQREEKQQTGLSSIAEHYGLGFGDEQAHSATADTRLTLECFKALVNDFNRQTDAPSGNQMFIDNEAGNEDTLSSLENLSERYKAAYETAMHTFRMRNLQGYINVIKREQGYTLRYSRFEPKGLENLIFSVPVTDRTLAEEELRKHFEPIQVKGFTGFYHMTDEDFEYIRNYSNTVDLPTYLERLRRKQSAADVTNVEKARKSIAAKSGTSKSSMSQKAKSGEKATEGESKMRSANKRKNRRNYSRNTKSKTRAATQAMRVARKLNKKE